MRIQKLPVLFILSIFILICGCGSQGRLQPENYVGTWTGTWIEQFHRDGGELKEFDLKMSIVSATWAVHPYFKFYSIAIFLDDIRYVTFSSLQLIPKSKITNITLDYTNTNLVWICNFNGENATGTWAIVEYSLPPTSGPVISSGAFTATREPEVF